jgi:hypothetical protein
MPEFEPIKIEICLFTDLLLPTVLYFLFWPLSSYFFFFIL